jgi:ATP synthase protein I
MEEKKNKKKEFVELAKVSSVGFGVVIAVFIGYFIGSFIDKHVHSTPVFTIIFIIIGAGAGFTNVFRSVGKNSD